MSQCKCYRYIVGYGGICDGTKEQDPCSCGGDETKCDFYEHKREEAKKKRPPDLVEQLKNEITRRDNLLAEMGVRLPEDEPMEWEYKHIRGAWRRVSSDGWVICPRCKTVQIRLVGTWYKHCPECGKRLGWRGDNDS